MNSRQRCLSTLVAMTTVTMLCVSTSFAQEASEKIKTMIQTRIGPQAAIKSITKMPVSGIYEVILNNNVVYFDETARYMIQGNIVDLQSGENLTEISQTNANRIQWKDLPLDHAVKWSKGTGQRQIAVFADPNCGYCKRLEQTLQTLDNITVYTFVVPILGPDSVVKSKQIWCASNQSQAWLDWMLRNQAPTGDGSCSTTAIDQNVNLSRQYAVQGTPAIFFIDGTRFPGAVEGEKIEQKLVSLK